MRRLLLRSPRVTIWTVSCTQLTSVLASRCVHVSHQALHHVLATPDHGNSIIFCANAKCSIKDALQVFFAATGVSDGSLLKGVRYYAGGTHYDVDLVTVMDFDATELTLHHDVCHKYLQW